MNEGRYSRVGISPFWFTTSWTCRLSGRSPPSAYWFFHGVRQKNKCDCHLCDALYSYIRCSSSLSPLRRFQRVCVPIPPYQFLHYWYNCRCREHTRVRLNNKQKYQKTMIKLLLWQKKWNLNVVIFIAWCFCRLSLKDCLGQNNPQNASNICVKLIMNQDIA